MSLVRAMKDRERTRGQAVNARAHVAVVGSGALCNGASQVGAEDEDDAGG